jgi:hypothetical protein
VPANFLSDFSSAVEIRRGHQFHVLHILLGGTAGHFLHPFRLMSAAQSGEFCKGAKKNGRALTRLHTARTLSSKGIDQFVVQRLVVVRVAGRHNVIVALAARGILRRTTLHKCELLCLHA